MTEDINDALHRAAELLPDTPDRLQAVRRKRAGLVRRRATAALGVVALVVGGAAYGLMRTSGSTHTSVTANGDSNELTAMGRVVQVPGRPTRACANVASDAVGYSVRPAPAWCDLGIDVQGVDLAVLDDRFEKDGAVEGYATLTGHLEGDVLVVTKQEPRRDEPQPSVSIAPCTPPPGGWRDYGHETNPDVQAAQAYAGAHPDLVAEIAISRPSRTQAVPYLLTWGDPEPVHAALRSTYGDQMCLQRSQWTREQVAGAVAEFTHDVVSSQGVYSYGSGHSLTGEGQLKVDAEAVRSTPELEAIVARHPKGLIAIDYWLHPVTP
ncbi:MAG: hypothetical protein JWL79_2763 [Frankiales bacterium]|nr:hypothetical protein [Frankiales bacterium]